MVDVPVPPLIRIKSAPPKRDNGIRTQIDRPENEKKCLCNFLNVKKLIRYSIKNSKTAARYIPHVPLIIAFLGDSK
jgi:hypothetical protein